MTTAAEYNWYSEAAGNAVPLDRAEVARCAVWGDQAGAVRQCVSDERFELAIHNGFDTTAVTDSARGHIRQTAPAWVDVRLAEL